MEELEEKIERILQNVHQVTERFERYAQAADAENVLLTNRLMAVLCGDYDLSLAECANRLNRLYGYHLAWEDVLEVFRQCRLSHPLSRQELLLWSEQVADRFAEALRGDKKAFVEFERLRRQPALYQGRHHEMQERLAAVMIYQRCPEMNRRGDWERLQYLNNVVAKYYFFDLIDAVAEGHQYPQQRGKKGGSRPRLSQEAANKRIEQLERSLTRSNDMLVELQKEFEQQLEMSRTKELVEFFAQLNSEKYGCLLDELLALNHGAELLRKGDYQLPVEIGGLLIMVRKLIQFVRDNHISPMLKTGSLLTVTASDVEFWQYEGAPFADAAETKTVRVISPGWVYQDKAVQIWRPKVREEA